LSGRVDRLLRWSCRIGIMRRSWCLSPRPRAKGRHRESDGADGTSATARQLVVTMPHAVPIRSVRLRPNRGWCASCAITVSWRCMHLTLTALPISDPPRTARNLPLCVKSHTGRSSTVRTPDQAAGHERARSALDLAALIKHCLKLATSTRVESSADPNTHCEPTRWLVIATF
jgi:hypothetical protein